uniref:hypothetical protein n=1 Tax=Streptococcus thoraltensis TaxID=55085 RepID=UPI001F574209
KPVVPTLVSKPTPPLRPIIFYHQVKVSVPKPAKQVKPLKLVKSNSTKPTIRVPKSVSVVKANTVAYRPKPIPVYYTLTQGLSEIYAYVPTFSPKLVYGSPKVVTVKGSKLQKSSPKKQEVFIDGLSSEQINWFQKNIGVKNPKTKSYNLSKDDVRGLVSYIKDVRNMAIKKYGKNDYDNINHAVANAIAGISYEKAKSEAFVNDFNTIDYKKSKYYSVAQRVISDSHDNNYTVDLSHMMMPIATLYKSVWWKEFIKTVMSNTSFGRQVPESFFWLNSLVGDVYTNIDRIDRNADKDAFILKNRTNNQSPDLVTNFINLYGKKYNRADVYQKEFDSNKAKEKQHRATIIAARFSFGLGVIVVVSLLKKLGSKVVEFFKSIPSKLKQLQRKAGKFWSSFTGFTGYLNKLLSSVMGTTVYADDLTAPKQKIRVKQAPKKPTINIKASISKQVKRYTKPVVKAVKRYVKPVKCYTKPVVKAVKRYTKPIIRRARPIIRAVKRYIKPIIRRARPIIRAVKRYTKPIIRRARPIIRTVKRYTKPSTKFIKKTFSCKKRRC